ncbi:MAG: leucyl/phenylalanyl-tRNA--protein transferase [Clostridia bacterium]|nr:leucyl/phenylalanyl-tRNA--protein transferase [Clostridia bacterium]
MPVFRLTNELIFPNPELSREDGILAIGGDLSEERLLLAYSCGIFPWYSQEDPILWWSPDPRCILFPENIHISKSMKKFLKKGKYHVTFDSCFEEVITKCGHLRASNTWITKEMIKAYLRLHNLGFAHSVEVWFQKSLVGGLYGISLGNCFFGESMFSLMENASKTALITLADRFEFSLIDCQVYSDHLASLGAVNMPRKEFLRLLEDGLLYETLRGNWGFLNDTMD